MDEDCSRQHPRVTTDRGIATTPSLGSTPHRVIKTGGREHVWRSRAHDRGRSVDRDQRGRAHVVSEPAGCRGAWIRWSTRTSPSATKSSWSSTGPTTEHEQRSRRRERRRPDVRLRHVSSAAPTRAAAKNLGWSESVGRHVVFVHDEDRVSRRFLSAVVNVASEDDQIVLPLRVADLGDRPADVRAPAVLGLLAHAGQIVAPRRVALSLAPCVGIAFPRSLLTRQAFDPDLVIGEDSVLVGRLLSEASVTCAIPPTAAEGVYYHTTARNPQLPRCCERTPASGSGTGGGTPTPRRHGAGPRTSAQGGRG